MSTINTQDADAAWERAVHFVETTIHDARERFLNLLVDTTKSQCSMLMPSCKGCEADFCSICEAGDSELLEQVTFDLIAESLKRHCIPKFWASIPGSGGDETGRVQTHPMWHDRLCTSITALAHLHAEHEALLVALQTPRVASVVDQYYTCFRISLSESWSDAFVAQLEKYFQWTWELVPGPACIQARGKGKILGRDDHVEWWWAPLKGESAPGNAADRVLSLLNPARRPKLNCAAGPQTGCDALMGCSQIESNLENLFSASPLCASGGDDDGMPLTGSMEQEEDVEVEDDFPDEDDDSLSEDTASRLSRDAKMNHFRQVAESFQKVGLGNVWRDLIMHFLVSELARTVEDRCRSEYDAKGLLHQLTVWLYDPLLRWLRTAYGLPAVAARSLPVCSEHTSELGTALWSEDAWWTAARRVVLQFFETFVEVRIREAFDMVRDFPDSMPALLDLRRCLARTGRTAPLVRALRQQLQRRLLIAGAHTRDVIKVYIKTIKAMRLVDPRGLLLEAVSAPIRAYLKRRKDTVRCIVTALTEDSELQVELHAGAEAQVTRTKSAASNAGSIGDATRVPNAPPSPGAGNRGSGANANPGINGAPAAVPDAGPNAGPNVGVNSMPTTGPNAGPPPNAGPNIAPPTVPTRAANAPSQPEPPDISFGQVDYEISDDEEDPDSWMPDPIDADPLLPSRQRRAQDVISLLVGIYGSKEMFIKEYKEMLADRLLGNPSYSTERETQNLELLKTRFGEVALSHCEVMLQDIKDSKRINTNVQQQVKARQGLWPQHGGEAGVAGTMARPFMAPFSLSSIFGLCSSPAAGGLAPAGGSIPPALGSAASVASDHDVELPTQATQTNNQRLSLEQMHALVLSQHYWPAALAKADHPHFRLPDQLEEALAEYSSAYVQTRAKRSLAWKRAHGLVEVTVQLADRSLSVVVTPVHLAVLACFNEGGDADTPKTDHPSGCIGARLSLQDASARLELPEALVRKRVGFWVSKGVLREVSAGVFAVQESLSTMEGAAACGSNHLDEDAEHSPGQSAVRVSGAGGHDAACAAELEACEAFVQGMLTNYTSLPLSRIHNFLQMFMTDPLYTQTESQLRDFLTRLCQEGRLEFNGSNYTLVKKT